jgi:hypothetical protein
MGTYIVATAEPPCQHGARPSLERRTDVTLKLAAVTVDCDDALIVARFWAAALERPLDPQPWTVLQDPEGNEFCVAQTR